MQLLEDVFFIDSMMKYMLSYLSVLRQFCVSDLGGCTVAIVWPMCLRVVAENHVEL